MTLKDAKKEAIDKARSYRYSFLTISKQKEIGWYAESKATQRTVFWVNRDGSLELYGSDFARNYQRQYLPNIKLKKQTSKEVLMSKYKIGITEAGDAGLDLSWVDKLGGVDGAIAITKNPTPQFVEAVISNMDKLIVHATITGYGSSVVEPNVPSPHNVAKSIMNLVDAGFPKEKLVIRVDPIIPTNKGTNLAYSVIERFMALGFARYRISVIDMYPHCRKRFEDANLPLPYGTNFSPSADQLHRVNMAISNLKNIWEHEQPGLRIECCAEPGLSEAIQCGCISVYDLNLLGLDGADTDDMGFQRKHCLCYSGKTELLEHKARCPHGCLYCYWR